MKKIEIEIPEGKEVQWVGDTLKLVDIKKPITERIKTFEDACKELGNHPFIKEYALIDPWMRMLRRRALLLARPLLPTRLMLGVRYCPTLPVVWRPTRRKATLAVYATARATCCYKLSSSPASTATAAHRCSRASKRSPHQSYATTTTATSTTCCNN